MSKNLVIVESPAKARTIERYLGKDYEVLASYGHVRDLVPKGGAVDPEHGFAMKYQVIEKNKRHVQNIARALRRADALYLATDPDREGEAISWHVCEILKEQGALRDKPVYRVVFHEITRAAIHQAITAPRQLSDSLINAQQARRALDYLVGFNLSPLLWKKIRRGLSAGRVQSPALRLIADREEEIAAFKPREYWTITAHALRSGEEFETRLIRYNGKKVEQFTFGDKAAAEEAEQTIRQAAAYAPDDRKAAPPRTSEPEVEGADAARRGEASGIGVLTVVAVEKKQRRRRPAAPYTTSTLQQDATRKLRLSASQTMSTAQRLYEAGLITYMRTDSVTLASAAINELRKLIAARYGEYNLPAQPRRYVTKAKNAQEAHEAIRPTSAKSVPEALRAKLPSDQHRLYELIWKRTVASQMNPALYDTVSLDLTPGEPDQAAERAMLAGESGAKQSGSVAKTGSDGHVFRATGSILVKPGWLTVYGLDRREGSAPNQQRDLAGNEETNSKRGGREQIGDRLLPPMATGDQVTLAKLVPKQHFTDPPPRYSEATLVKSLEEYGIGRPSTYAAILSTLRDREYVTMESRRFVPTDMGKVVNRFLTQHFKSYVDYEFTARMEDRLDAVSRGEREWTPLLGEFWQPFRKRIDEIDSSVTRAQAVPPRPLGTDPKSGRPVFARFGRYGPMVQIGDVSDDAKPDFASLLPDQKIDRITLEEALKLFTQPRQLGTDPASGRPVFASRGRYGPFVQLGARGDKPKPAYASLLPGQEVDHIALEEALQLLQLPRDLGETESGEPVSAGIGRLGPYVRYGRTYVNLREDNPCTIELPRALELIAQHVARGGFRGKRRAAQQPIAEFAEAGITVLNGRYGPYVTDGKKNASVPKGRKPEELTLEECKELIAAAPQRRGRGRRRTGGGARRGRSRSSAKGS